jgi:hypothetical protein
LLNGKLRMTPRQQRLLEIETARMRHAWAKAEVERGTASPALTKYLEESLQEWRALKAKKKPRSRPKKSTPRVMLERGETVSES